jgi:hypothetical protein
MRDLKRNCKSSEMLCCWMPIASYQSTSDWYSPIPNPVTWTGHLATVKYDMRRRGSGLI